MEKNKFSILKAYHFPKLNCEPDAEVTLFDLAGARLLFTDDHLSRGSAGDKGRGCLERKQCHNP